jgi:hypothetical protein
MESLPSNFERQSFLPRYISEGQWGENRLKAERAWFLTEEVRRAEPETEPLLTRWGKSGVFSESTVLSFLKQSSGPTPSGSLKVDSERLNLPMSLHPSLNTLLSDLCRILPTLNGRGSLNYEHAVAVAVKPVFLPDSFFVGFLDEIQTGKGRYHHQQG